MPDFSKLKEDYEKAFDSKFYSFCEAYKMTPKVRTLYGFMRLASPFGIFPTADSQFYVKFISESDERSRNVHLGSEVEHEEFKWITPREALEEYKLGKLPLIQPQLLLILSMSFYNSAAELKQSLEYKDANLLTYTANKAQMINFEEIEEKEDRRKLIKYFFDKSDFRPDSEKENEMYIFKNTQAMEEFGLSDLSNGAGSVEEFHELIRNYTIAPFSQDFYNPGESVPFSLDRRSRQRLFSYKGKIIRAEISKSIHEENLVGGMGSLYQRMQ